MSPPRISICILAGHGSQTLSDCLDSLLAQIDAPPHELIIGGRHGEAELSVVARRFPHAKICKSDAGHPGSARNALIAQAEGDLLLFLDDDVTVSPDLLARLAELASRYPRASVFGGPNDTPPQSSAFQLIQGAVLGSLVGSGPVSRRYGARHPGPADERWFTLCNLAVRREVMLPFRDDLICAEENALLSQLRAKGELMRYEPSLRVFHRRRSSWREFASQMFKYGRGRGQLLVRHPGTIRLAYLIPSALLLYALLVIVLAVSGATYTGLLLVPLGLYGLLALAGSLWIALTLRMPSALPRALALTLTVHGGYGIGVLRGVVAPRRSPPPATVRGARLDEATAPEPGR